MFTPPTKAYAATIFDVDGTLADSMPLHYQGFLHAFREMGASIHFDEDLFYSLGGKGLKEVVALLNEQNGSHVDPEKVFVLKNAYLEAHHSDIQPVAEVVAFARARKEEGQPVAVASGGHREEVLRTLHVIGLEGFFDAVVTRTDVTHGKPHPETYLRAAELLGVAPADCLVFEDAETGAQSARAAGMDVVMVRTRV